MIYKNVDFIRVGQIFWEDEKSHMTKGLCPDCEAVSTLGRLCEGEALLLLMGFWFEISGFYYGPSLWFGHHSALKGPKATGSRYTCPDNANCNAKCHVHMNLQGSVVFKLGSTDGVLRGMFGNTGKRQGSCLPTPPTNSMVSLSFI